MRPKSQTKYFNKSLYKPDPGVISALNSIKQNPKFSRLLAFSINCLNPLITPPNPRHRENANYLISQEGVLLIVKAINDHWKDDEILFNSTQLLLKLIGRGKFKDEKIANLIVSSGGVAALMKALDSESEKSKHTIKIIIELLSFISSNSKIAVQLIEQNVLETILKILSNSPLNPLTIFNGLETLNKILSYPECKNVLFSRDLLPLLQNLITKKAFNPQITSSALKLLESLSRTMEGIEYMKKNNVLQTIVFCMEKHPYEKDLLNNGSAILSKIVTLNDLNHVLGVIKNNEQNENSLLNISILSQLALIDEMMDEILKQGALKELIKIIEMNLDSNPNESPEKINLIKNCCIALGRIAEVDINQFLQVYDQGALKLLKRTLCEVNNSEVIEVALNTLIKLNEIPDLNHNILGEEGENFLESIFQVIEKFKNDLRCCESFLSFLFAHIKNPKISQAIFQNGALKTILEIMEKHLNNKNIQEKNMKLLLHLIQQENDVEKLNSLKGFDLLYKINKIHPNWRRFQLDFLALIEKIFENFDKLSVIFKNNESAVEAIIIVLSRKNFEIMIENTATSSIANETIENEMELQEMQEKDENNLNIENQIKTVGIKILFQILDLQKIEFFYKKIQEKALVLKENLKHDPDFEFILAFFSHVCSIREFADFIVKNRISMIIVEISQELIKKKDFLGKLNYLICIIDFFFNLNTMDFSQRDNEIIEMFKKLQIEKYFLNFLYDLIQKNDEPFQIIYSLKALGKMISKAIVSHQKTIDKSKKNYFEDLDENEQKKYIDNVIDAVMNTMKKYSDHEALQLAGIDILNLITRMSYVFNSSLVKLGVTRFIISKLEEETTLKSIGLACFNLLRNIGAFSKEALILMNNQKAATAIMNFLSHQSHDSIVTEAATPILKLLSNVENLEIFEELEADIQEMIKTINPILQGPNYLRSNALESLELLNNFSLIDQALELILKNNIMEALSNLLQFETTQNESLLLETGELSNNDKVISSSLGLFTVLLSQSQSALSKEIGLKFMENVIAIIKSPNYLPNQIKEAAKTLRLMLRRKINDDFLVEQCIKSGFLDNLLDSLEKYKENVEITQEINGLLLDLTKKSKEIAEILSEKDYIKILIKETRALFKQFLTYESMEIIDRMKENINCLTIFILLGELNAKNSYQSNCLELAFSIISKGVEKQEDEQKNYQGKEKDLSKEIRLFSLENYKQVVSLNCVFPETIKLCLALANNLELCEHWNKKDYQKLFIKAISFFYKFEGIVLLFLELILKVLTPEFKEYLMTNDFFKVFSVPLNYFPLNKKIENFVGELFLKLNPQIYCEKLSALELENINDLLLLDLANSLVIYSNPRTKSSINGSGEMQKCQDILGKVSLNFDNNSNSLGTQLIFIGRACYLGEEIKNFTLKSSLPNQIIALISKTSKEDAVLLEISLDVLNKILTIPINISKKIDLSTWDYQENKPSYFLTETLSDLYVNNEGKHLNELVYWAENKDEGMLAINHKALELLFNCAYLHPQIAAFLNEMHGLKKMQELYEDICKRSHELNENLLVNKLCKLICAMSRIQVCFDEILKNTSFLQILMDSISNITIAENISKENCAFFEEFLWCLGVLTDNNFDKAELLERKVLEVILEKINDFLGCNIQVLCEKNEDLGNIFIQTIKTLKILEKDPSMLRRICSDEKKVAVILKCLHNMCEKNKENSDEMIVFEGSPCGEINLDLIESSDKMKEKIIENILNCFVELTKNPLILELFDFIESPILDEAISFICSCKNNLIVVVRGLKLIENAIKYLNERELLKNLYQDHPKLSKIQNFADKIAVYYANVPIIISITENIKLIINGKVTRTVSDLINSEISNSIGDFGAGKSIDQEIADNAGRRKRSSAIANTTEILTKLGYVSNSFDYFVKKVEQKKNTPSDGILTGKLLSAIGNFATNFDKKVKLFNMGVVDSILFMVFNAKIDDSIKFGGYEVLSKIFLEKKIVWKYMMNKSLVEGIKEELKVINAEAFPELPLLKKNTLKSLLKMIHSLCENPTLLEHLFQEKIIEILLDILLANKGKIDIVIFICEALASMAKKPHIIKELIEFGVLELLMEFYDKYITNLNALRAFASLIGEMASNSPEAQESLGLMAFPYLIIEGVKLYPQDLALTTSSCFSLSCLCYNNQKNSDFITKSEMIKPICLNLIKNFGKEKELMSNIALLISSLCFKNNPNKKFLGSIGSISALMSVLYFYTKKENIEEKVLKNCLKALGNLSLLIENSTLLIQNNFVKIADEFITNNNNLDSLVKFFLDILSNLASFPEEINYVNLMELMEQGIVGLLIKCINQNELNTNVMLSSIKTLDYLCSNKSIRKNITNPQVFLTLFKILKSQDWNQDLVLKILRILTHIIVSERINLFFDGKLQNTIVDIIRVQTNSTDILVKSFKLLTQLCADKTKAKLLFNAGLIPVIFLTTEKTEFKKEFIYEFFHLISKLGRFCDQASEQICQIGFSFIRVITQENIDDMQIVEMASLVMQNISDINSNVDSILQQNGLELCQTLITKYTKYENIVPHLMKFLQNIAETNDDYRKLLLSKNIHSFLQEILDREDIKESIRISGVKAKASIEIENKEVLPEANEILGMVFKFKLGQTKSLINKDIKNFLLAGRICKLYKSNGDYKNMHIFCNPDFSSIMAKRPMKKEEKKNIWKISIKNIKETIFDYTYKEIFQKSVFAKAGGLFRKKADPELCMSLIGDFPKKSEEKSFFIEAPNLIEKQRWMECFKALIEEMKRQEKANASPKKI